MGAFSFRRTGSGEMVMTDYANHVSNIHIRRPWLGQVKGALREMAQKISTEGSFAQKVAVIVCAATVVGTAGLTVNTAIIQAHHDGEISGMQQSLADIKGELTWLIEHQRGQDGR